jgi:hypothetical protein
MPSTPVLVLIALTVLACAFIVALLLRIRANRLQVTPVFDMAGSNPYEGREITGRDWPYKTYERQPDGSYKLESKAKEEAEK